MAFKSSLPKEDFHTRIRKATKWSSLTEIVAKLVAPISTMVLARILSPEAFGVLVTAVMVINFADIFTDAGFQKYIIQHEFENEESLYKSTNVAFLSNLTISTILWVVILIFCNQIAELVGNPGYGHVIAVASICLPLTAFSSIQMAMFRRNLDFKTLFTVRMVGVFIPIFITIPLALIFRSYWALIIGMVALNLSNAILLTLKSKWKPSLWYDISLFKQMFMFTSWTLLESVAIWLTGYSDIFIVGRMLNEYDLGLYRTSMVTVSQIIGIITAATTPVLFASLSRVQNDDSHFRYLFLKFQKTVSMILIPLGVGIYIFQNLITEIMLGEKWLSAAFFIGLWGLMNGFTITFSHYSSEVYRSKGRPKLSFLSQFFHIIVLIPLVLWATTKGFHFLCEMRAMVKLEAIFVDFILMYLVIKVSPLIMIKNVFPSCIAAFGMYLISLTFPHSENYFIQFLYILPCVLIYFLIILLFKQEREILFNFKSILRRRVGS